MDDRSIARWRMHTLRLSGRAYPSAPAAVAGMLAVQAENYQHTLWALAERTDDARRGELQRLFDDGAILRTHVLRPTWHFVLPDDIRWLLELTAPRIKKTMRGFQRELGMDDAALQDATQTIAAVLSGGLHLTRAALAQRLRDEGWASDGPGLALLLQHAELSAVICSGRMEGSQQTYALLDQRAPQSRRLSRDEGLAELVRRYFRGHGPATERDLSYWATMTLTDVRAGIAAVADQLEHVEVDGRTYWFTDPPPGDANVEPRGHLLLVLDEYHNGYQDSRYVLDADGIVPRGRGANVGMALIDGQMVGDMRRTISGETVTFEIGLFRAVADDEVHALEQAADRCGRFLGTSTARVRLARPECRVAGGR